MTHTPHDSTKQQPVPHFTGTLAMFWFLAGLTMLFGAGMLGYLFIRLNQTGKLAVGSLHLPRLLWVSTALVLVASITIQLALSSIRRERQDLMRAWLLVTLIVGILFCIVQTPAMASLFSQHKTMMDAFYAAGGRAAGAVSQPFFGLIFVFILIHAAHVIGGIIQLVLVTRGAFLGRYDHEYHNPVKHAAMYWHFLDFVWVVMYGTMAVIG